MRLALRLAALTGSLAIAWGASRAADADGPTNLPGEDRLVQAPKDKIPPATDKGPPDKEKAPPPKAKEPAPAEQAAAADNRPTEQIDLANLPPRSPPQFLGDFLGSYVARRFTATSSVTLATTIPAQLVTSQVIVDGRPVNVKVLVPGRVVSRTLIGRPADLEVLVPNAFLGAFKIAENESPKPEDRVFLTYDFFNNVRLPLTAGGTFPIVPVNSGGSSVGVGLVALSHLDVHREVLGFEKTFFDGQASFGLRVPMIQVEGGRATVDGLQITLPPVRGVNVTASADVGGDVGIAGSHLGDLSLILKYALYNDHSTGDVVSTGLLLTVPTGDNLRTLDERIINPVLGEPFAGFIWNSQRVYVQGFSSICFALGPSDVTHWFNDLGVGYWLYRAEAGDRLLKGVVPTFEVHVDTPLNHRDGFQPGPDTRPLIGVDVVDLTAGVHVVFGHNSTLTVGGCVPVTGPLLNDFEIIAQLNVRF
jgi:hypothetical protein